MTTDLTLVTAGADGTATTDTERIAIETENDHASVLRLVRDNLYDLNEFGRVGFEIRPFATAGGEQKRQVAILNEEHATLLLTYMRNNAIVRDFKKRLVREFYAMKRGPVASLSPAEQMAHGLIAAQQMLEEKDARIGQLEEQATANAPKVTYVDNFVTDADLPARAAS